MIVNWALTTIHGVHNNFILKQRQNGYKSKFRNGVCWSLAVINAMRPDQDMVSLRMATCILLHSRSNAAISFCCWGTWERRRSILSPKMLSIGKRSGERASHPSTFTFVLRSPWSHALHAGTGVSRACAINAYGGINDQGADTLTTMEFKETETWRFLHQGNAITGSDKRQGGLSGELPIPMQKRSDNTILQIRQW